MKENRKGEYKICVISKKNSIEWWKKCRKESAEREKFLKKKEEECETKEREKFFIVIKY